MSAPDTGDRPPGAAAGMSSQSGLAAALTPVLTVAASLLGLGLLWGLAANAWPSRAFPGPGQVWQVLLAEAANGDLFYHLGATLGRVAAAYVVAMVIGSVIGVLLGSHRRADRFFNPWVVLFLNIPALVVIVLAYIWFGLNEAAAIGAVAVNKIPNVVVTMREGARALDPSYAEMAAVYRFGLARPHSPCPAAATAALSCRRLTIRHRSHLEDRPGGRTARPLQRRRLPDLSLFPALRRRRHPCLHPGFRGGDACHRTLSGAAR